ncbi:hypothetical protein [Cellulosimicrobium sp. CUA-896]|uniref:hypothetical protein n=1 Tax=Cellulosimicrobium sp. CUA-896 TaxID=1517881 RepID=UPI001301370A|nr:hypothetical protein [Cellulosimicrobium sp. CUA-896]
MEETLQRTVITPPGASTCRPGASCGTRARSRYGSRSATSSCGTGRRSSGSSG